MAKWPSIVQEFVRREDTDLPFYLWTLKEPPSSDLGSFDVPVITSYQHEDHPYAEPQNPMRLHKLQRHGAQDAGKMLVSGANFIPAKHRPSIRQQMFRPEVGVPPVPIDMLQ